jgi:aminomethyltransferase
MPIPTPFHPRTQALCTSYAWKHWSGYYAVRHYDESPEREYNAVRQAAGLLDVTPLYKYEVHGPEAGAFLDYVLAKRVSTLKEGRITYLCWCDGAGKVIDDGTCWRLAPDRFRLTSASPSWAWLDRHGERFGVQVEDVTDRIAALALQGPTSRAILEAACGGDVAQLRFFGWTRATFEGGVHAIVSRTGYTGDLGYEIWVENRDALALWDTLMRVGRPYGIWPIGLDTLDIARIEAGFLLQGCDYFSALDAVHPAHKSSPFEIGLGWTVQLDREPFIGQRALALEKERGSTWAFVGLEIDWESLERAFDRHDLPPALPKAAWRQRIPLYLEGVQVGYATSGTWSPMLKKNLALATVRRVASAEGTELEIEVLADWERTRVPARVSPLPFFDPPRKRS